MADPGGNNSRLAAGALFSTAFPPVGVAAGALDSTGTEMLPLNLDASGNLKIAGNFTATLGGTTNVNITEVGGLPVVLGQALMSASFPVVIASNQSAIPVSGSFSATNPAVGTTGTTAPASADFIGLNVAGNLRGWTGLNISGSVYAGQADISSFGGAVVALGQVGMTASIPVVLASNQSNVTTVLGAALPAGTNAIGTVSVLALPAGTNAVGTVSALQSGTWTAYLGVGTNAVGTVSALQSGTWTSFLGAGTNAIGTVSALQVGTWTVNFAGSGISLRGATTASGTAAVVLIAAQNATTKIYVTGLQFGNTSGTTVVVELNDSALSNFIVPAGGGNNPPGFLVPLVLASANASLTFSVLGTAVTTIYVNAQGYGAA
jgi:hypothetical protein